MKPGIYNSLSNEDYHSSDGISRSGVMAIKKSPLHYWHEYVNPKRETREKDTPSTIFGNAFHTYILENESFKDRFIVCDKVDRRTTDGKKYWAKIKEERGGKSIIDIDDYNQLSDMANSLMNHDQAGRLIFNATYENSIYWNDPLTGVLCKCRPDIMSNNMIVDLKTTDDANPDTFRYSIRKYGYHVQAAMLLDGMNAAKGTNCNNFIIIAIEKNPPYACAVYVLDKAAIDIGREFYKSALVDYKKCFNENKWPTYETQTISI